MKIKVTSVYVDDQDKALRFYTQVLGFEKVWQALTDAAIYVNPRRSRLLAHLAVLSVAA